MYQRLAQAVNSQPVFGQSPVYCKPWTSNLILTARAKVMAGLGWLPSLQATVSGRQMIMVSGCCQNVLGNVMGISLRAGGGSPPAANATMTGSPFDASVDPAYSVAASTETSGYNQCFLLRGVLPAGSNWFDLGLDNSLISGSSKLNYGCLTIFDV